MGLVEAGDGGHDIADVTEHLVHQPVHIGVGVAELGGGQQQGPQGGVLLKVGVQGGLHPGHGHPLLLKDEFFQGGQAVPHVGGAGQGHGEEIVRGGAAVDEVDARLHAHRAQGGLERGGGHGGEGGLVRVLDGVAVGDDVADLGAEGVPQLVEGSELGAVPGVGPQMQAGHPVDARR